MMKLPINRKPSAVNWTLGLRGGATVTRKTRWSLPFAVGGVLLFSACGANAATPADGIRQFKHSSWTSEDGAPSNITDMAQSPDGYLWLAGKGGLYRFDGVTFERIHHAVLDKDLASASRVMVSRSGTVWAAFGNSLAYYRQGKLHAVPGPSVEAIGRMTEGPDGAIWFHGARPGDGVYRYLRGRFEQVGEDWGVPKLWVADILATRTGTIWMAAAGKLMFLPQGGRRFYVMDENVGLFGGLAEDAGGNIWFSGRDGTRLVRNAASPLTKPTKTIAYPAAGKTRGVSPMIDRADALWGSNWSNGIFRIPLGISGPAGGAVDSFGVRDGLSSDVNERILEDREGNIWVGTQLGLDRFRPTPVTMEPAIEPSPEGYMITQDGQGNVFIAANDMIYEIAPGQGPRIAATWPEPVNAICPARDGSIWVSSDTRLSRLRNGTLQSVQGPGVAMSSYGCREDRERRTWFLADQGSVMGRLPDGRWVNPVKPLTDYSPFLDIALNSEGHVVVKWGTENIRVIGERVLAVIPQHALGTKQISGITDARTGLFVTGDGLLGRWRGNRVQTLDIRRSYPWLSMRGMIQTPRGETWMIGSNGILRLSTAKLDHAFDRPGMDIPYQRFDANDGLRALVQHTGYRGPQVAQGGDGRIWFLTASGVARADPANLRKNLLPPPVTVRSLSAGGQTYVDPVSVTLPSGTRVLDIAYTALSLSVPNRVRFRYQLEGADETWVDPGPRREAFYTNLGPGRYRFRVIASNNDGVWNRTGATLDIEIRPAFYQTWWFLLLCLLPGIGLVRLLYAMRLRQVARQVRHQMEIRIAERERIARELHDTLLQSFQGVTMLFQSIAERFPAGSPLRESIEEGLDYADAAVTEGRERVRELRSATVRQDFAEELLHGAAAIIAGDTPRLSVGIKGTPRRLVDAASDELFRVMQEAVRNAVQHAGAKTIEIVLNYGAWTLILVVRDDGTGIPESIHDCGNPVGHYGLLGMRERAERIGGRFELARRLPGGTEISVSAPAHSAYRDGRRWVPVRLMPLAWRRLEDGLRRRFCNRCTRAG